MTADQAGGLQSHTARIADDQQLPALESIARGEIHLEEKLFM
ncbi:hypothetical protein [Burkholderia cepacia]|nr:hypothetical protein [Burkholderia cepacia]